SFSAGRNGSSAAIPACESLIVQAETLKRIAEVLPDGPQTFRTLITAAAAHVFIFGFDPSGRHDAIVAAMSQGRLTGVRSLSNRDTFQVATARRFCAQFSALGVSSVVSSRDHGFLEAAGSDLGALISVGSSPFFIRLESEGCQLFFAGCRELADLEEPIDR